MRIGIVIAGNDPETVWNAFRYGVFALQQGDPVKVFLLGKGVECESLADGRFNVGDQLRAFVEAGGQVMACGTCLEARRSQGSDLCPISTLQDLHRVIRESERLLAF